MTMTLHASNSAGEPSDRGRQEPQGRDHEKNEELDCFSLAPVERANTDQSLFARDVELHEHDDREMLESLPEDGFVM